jgi:sulfur-oxidizing protein SoxY
LLLAAIAMPALAEPGPDDPTRIERWNDLRHMILNDRPVGDGKGIVEIDAPVRALDAALVPLTIHLPGGPIKALWLVIDDNPAPLAATFHFGPAADTREIRTRVRVDDYSLIHAVAEREYGSLVAATTFVKASGGCSAPASGDPEEALARMGQMRLKAANDGPKGVEQVQLLISHPNFNGMQMDPVSRLYTPAHYVQAIDVRRGSELVFDAAADISLSEDPSITFGLRPDGEGGIDVDVRDSTDAHFRQHFDLPKLTD